MLSKNTTYPIDKVEWESLVVVQPKNHDPKKLRIFIDFRGLNKLTLTDMFPTPFSNEIVNEFAGHECYSFTNGFPGYNQVPIAK
jgi:hypothetical protein